MSDTPQISILIPIYNVESYLVECLDSVVSQSFGDFEVLCINDGSTDASRDIIMSYVDKDPRFRLLDKPNSGYGASMNRGLDEARGTYIAILESDDFYAPDMLQKLHAAAEANDAQVVKANCYHYWSTPRKKSVFRQLVPRNLYGQVVDTRERRAIFYLQQSLWSGLYRRDFLDGFGIRFLETPGASYQDASFTFKVWFLCSRAVFLPDALLYYRQDNMSSSVNSAAKVYCVVDEFHEIERFVAERSAFEHEASEREGFGCESLEHEVTGHTAFDWAAGLVVKLKFDTYLWNYERLAEEFKLEFLLHMATELRADVASGALDWSLFERWDALDLQAILASPEAYHQARSKSGHGSNTGKARYMLSTGGPVTLARFIHHKLSGRYYDR